MGSRYRLPKSFHIHINNRILEFTNTFTHSHIHAFINAFPHSRINTFTNAFCLAPQETRPATNVEQTQSSLLFLR